MQNCIRASLRIKSNVIPGHARDDNFFHESEPFAVFVRLYI